MDSNGTRSRRWRHGHDTLVIQRAKLDELLKAGGRADAMTVDDEDAEDVEKQRKEIRRSG